MARRAQDQNRYVPASFRQAGMTYRQMDYWVRRGYLHPAESRPGSGNARVWPPEELEVGRRMAVLVQGGYTPATAARLAREGAAPSAQQEVSA